jgi:exodeoxyribonuclease V beta subunit
MVRVRVRLPFLGPFFRARSFFRNPLRFIARRLFRISLRIGIFTISFGLGGWRLGIRLGILKLMLGGGKKKSRGGRKGGSKRGSRAERASAKMERGSQALRGKLAESIRSERAERDAQDASEREERERPEREAREKVEREVRDKAERDKAERDKAERDKAERDKAERDKAERDTKKKRESSEREDRERVEQREREPKGTINRPDDELLSGVHRKVFDINSPLPFQKRVLLEASAGTGKTFNLTSLVARYVAEEDLKIDQLLMVTFTNAAASEMRERTRAKLGDALTALDSNISPDLVKEADIWMKNIVDCSGEIREDRKSRLRDAISGIDSATITTIHGFFQQALREVGLRSADSASSEVAQGKDSLGKQILRDELVTMFAAGEVNLMDALPDKTPNDLEKSILEIIKGLNSNISATAAPEGDENSLAHAWSSFINQIRKKINDQRISSGTLSFDDLITGLRDLLNPENPLSADVINGMRTRYRLVLIDEFQDTDDTQWDIFSKIFDVEYIKSVQGTTRNNETFLAMIMVGDPKQAIYRFRGADIAAYLKAVEDAKLERFEMKRNYRSDRNLITGLNRWFQGEKNADGKNTGFKFGNKNIAFIQVDAAKKGAGSGLTITGHENESKALQFRWIATDQKPAPTVKVLRPRIAEDLCNHVALLLNKGTIADKRDGVVVNRSVQPGDISILVRTHGDAEPIVEALRARGIPVVKSNVGSVSQSESVDQLRKLLSAMASPNDSRRVKALALTWFVGYSFNDLLDDKKIIDLGIRCNEWAKKLVDLGIVGFYQTLRAEESAVASISLSVEAERRLTDLEHLAELLHSRTAGKKLSAASVLRYLDELAAEEDESDELLRRIDSDAKAIQITTMHASKGLEYPIVLVPFPKAPNIKGAQVFTYENRRLVNAAPNIPWVAGDLNEETRKAIAQEEIEGDDLRLMYVAFTRAKHQLVVWWANSKGMATSPLARLLFGDHEDITKKTKIEDGDDARKQFNDLQGQIGFDDDNRHIMHVTELAIDDISVVPMELKEFADHSIGQSSEFPSQAVRNWNWRRWSFSSLSSSLKNEDSDSHRGGSDEGEATIESEVPDVAVGSSYSGPGLFEMPASAEFGTLVHQILEKVNLNSLTLKEDLIETISEYGSETLRGISVENLALGLLDSLGTSLEPLVPGFQFTDLDSRDRLAEMDFHFSLAKPEVSAEQIALVAADDDSSLFAEYFGQLAQKWHADGGRSIAGLMTGSIDVLFRVRSGDRHKYFVVDYKSNRLHSPSGKVPHAAYGVDSMKTAMEHHHYPLQALFYCVALHRFLSMRVSDYDIDRDLGGAGYLFVRGMVGGDTPLVDGTRNGVMAWRPSTQVILRINSLLGGEPK